MDDLEEQGTGQANRMMLLPAGKDDGNVAVVFAEDKLRLTGDFYPPMHGGKPLDTGDIAASLARSNIVHGVLWDNINTAIFECNTSRKLLRDVTIARGNPPVAEVLEYFQKNPALKSQPEAPKGNERLDHHTLSPFIIVKKGQALAKRKSRKDGFSGKDIYGQEIPHGTVRPEGVSAGENTTSDGTFIYSGISGQLIEEKGVLSVQDSLVIKGAIDYHTGNIVFPGDVTIEGPVSDGFKIFSGGSVTIKQTFDVTEAVTKNDLTVSGGIIGRGRALLKVGGTLKTKFIENCKAACRKTVVIDSEIVNSSVYTMEKIEMDEKGKILGSEIYAVHGLKTGSIGKKTGKATKVHCGVDFTAQQEQEKYNSELRIMAAKLKKLKELLEAEKAEKPELPPDSPELRRRAKIEETLVQLEEEQKQTTAKASEVFARLYADESAVVEVSGEIAQGTLIEICKIALFINEPLRHVRIRLDRALGRLVSEPL
jgi:uncharacterized protein (DUF342 family)